MSTYEQFIKSSPPPEFVIKASDRHAETLIRILVALQQSEELTVEETFSQKFTKGEACDVGRLLQVAHDMTAWKGRRNLWAMQNPFERMNHEDSMLTRGETA